jgi:methionine synthase II (cobalamin-independent)
VEDLIPYGIYTSTIGSFPLEDSFINRNRIIDDLLKLGIDFPTYPQLVDMGKQFLDDLVAQNSGLFLENGRYKLIGRNIEQADPPPGLEPFFWSLQNLKEKGIKTKAKLKASITGPFTLASYIEIQKGNFPFNTAISNLELVEKIEKILCKCCEAISRDASILSIDEPILGVIVGKGLLFGLHEEDLIEVYNNLIKACGDIFVGTHICGKLSKKLANILLDTKLNFLSHEFYDIRENIRIYTPHELELNRKILSIGCVSSKNPKVENIDEILGFINHFRKYGNNIFFTPDCGFRRLTMNNIEKAYEVSIKKLENMVKAVERFKTAF